MPKTGHIFQFLLFSLVEALLRNGKVTARGSPISTKPVNSECALNRCSLLADIAVLQYRGISFFCAMTTKDFSIDGNSLQVVLMDTDTEFVLGESNCQWRISKNHEYLYCNIHIQQNFTTASERHLLYFTTPGDIYKRFTVNVIADEDDAFQGELCEELSTQTTLSSPADSLRTDNSVHLYQDVKKSNAGPSLLGKLAVTTIAMAVLLFCILGIRWYYKSRRKDGEANSNEEEGDRMIVYKTQPTWCQDPDTDSDVNELEPFYCNDSDE